MQDKHELKWKLVNFSEIDKYAIKSYCSVHGVSEGLNLGDVASIKEEDMPCDIDLVTYGFPCQDLSVSGKLNGFVDKDGHKTRSGLFFDAFNFIKKVKPKIAIAENVKNLASNRFADEFNTVLSLLEEAGYNNYWKVLNAKDYGVPQNRERVFIISIRKDIDNGKFKFPDPIGLDLCLLDELEDEVDDKYYLSEEQINRFIHNDKNTKHGGGGIKILGTTKNPSAKGTNSRSLVYSPEGIIGTLCATDYKQPKQILQVGQLYPNSGNPQAGRVYDPEGISPTLNTCGGGNRQVKILIKEATKKGYTEAEVGDGISLERPGSKTRRGRIGKGVSSTLTTSCNQGVIEDVTGGGRPVIRKLTPKEYWRLMAFDDEDFEKAKATGTSNTQLYKQAGNSIVVNCNYYIFKELFRAFPDVFEDMRVVSLFSGIGAFEKALERLYKELNEE